VKKTTPDSPAWKLSESLMDRAAKENDPTRKLVWLEAAMMATDAALLCEVWARNRHGRSKKRKNQRKERSTRTDVQIQTQESN
jgi:hypothetical protein